MRSRGQEEMVGFAMIIIFVALAILAFLVLTLTGGPDRSALESAQVKQFVQTALQTTTSCQEVTGEYQVLQEVIRDCSLGRTCTNQRSSCAVAQEAISAISDSAWPTGPEWPTSGYSFLVGDEGALLNVTKGDATSLEQYALGLVSTGSRGEPLPIRFVLWRQAP